MFKFVAVFLAAVIFYTWQPGEVYAQESGWRDISAGYTDFQAILISPDNPQVIYAGAKGSVLKSLDCGASWRQVLSVKGAKRQVNFLAFGESADSLYAATGNGLFFSPDAGRAWRKIFKGRNAAEENCSAAASFGGVLYLGTGAGLFTSPDNGRSWQKQAGEPGKLKILAITCGKKVDGPVLVASSGGVFKKDGAALNWAKIFTAIAAEEDGDEGSGDNDRDEPGRSSDISYIALDGSAAPCFWLATARGILKSDDSGNSWQDVSQGGLSGRDAHFIAVFSGSQVYAAVRDGLFEYRDKRWQGVSLLLDSGLIHQAVKSGDDLYLACDKGLFTADSRRLVYSSSIDSLRGYYKGEPPIKDIQRVAIKYAEVSPEKIKNWRRLAASRAVLPKFSASVNRDTGDLWHWESGSSTRAYDDVLMKGNDAIGWDVTLSWDLADIVWSNEQTSIDVRSRLTVQLRDDILDEVNKAYFERIRLKIELAELGMLEKKKRLEKELRMEELAAVLDGLTGGYFSKQLVK